jgi:tetratricopeptide (TPR) repeat protein
MSKRKSEKKELGGVETIVLPRPEHTITLRGRPAGVYSEFHTIIQGTNAILAADEFSHRVLVFDSSGHFVRSFGRIGSGTGRFRYPRGLALVGEEVWVCDSLNHRIQVFDGKGKFLRAIADDGMNRDRFREPVDIELYVDGLVLVADRRNHRVVVMNRLGREVAFWGAREPARKPWMDEGFLRRVGRYPPAETGLKSRFSWEFINQIRYRHGKVWTADNKRIAVFGPLGELIFSFELAPLVCLRGLVPLEEAVAFLEERSGGLALMTTDGEAAVFEHPEGRLHGCFPTPDGRVGAIQGETLLIWPAETLLKGVKGVRRRGLRDETGISLVVSHTSAGSESKASEHLGKMFDAGEVEPEAFRLAARMGRLLKNNNELKDRLVGSAAAQLRRGAKKLMRAFKGLHAADRLLSTAYARANLGFALWPNINLAPNPFHLTPGAAALTEDLYNSIEMLYACAEFILTLGGRDSADAAGEAVGKAGKFLLEAAEEGAQRRSSILEEVKKLLEARDAGDPAVELTMLNEFSAGFLVSTQVLTAAADVLEDLMPAAWGRQTGGRGKLRSLHKKLMSGDRALANALAYGWEGKPVRDFYGWEYVRAAVPDEERRLLIEGYTEFWNLFKNKTPTAPVEVGQAAALAKKAWEFALLRERYARSFHILLRISVPLPPKVAAKVAAPLGFPEAAEKLEIVAKELKMPPVPADPLGDTLASLAQHVRSYAEGILAEGEFVARALYACNKDLEKTYQVAIHLRPWIKPATTLSLLTRAKVRPASYFKDWKTEAALELDYLLNSIQEAANSHTDMETTDSTEGQAPRPPCGDVAARLILAAHNFISAEPSLREALNASPNPATALDLARVFFGLGGEDEADEITQKTLTSFDLRCEDLERLVLNSNLLNKQHLMRELERQWLMARNLPMERILPCIKLIWYGGGPERALEIIKEWYELKPDRPDLLLLSVRILLWMERFDEALDILQKHDSRYGPTYVSMTLARNCHFGLRKFKQAEEYIRKSREFGQHPDICLVHQIQNEMAMGRRTVPTDALASIQQDSPAYVAKNIFICRQFFLGFKPAEALKVIREVSLEQHKNPDVAHWRVLVLLKLEQTGEVKRSFELFELVGLYSGELEGLKGVWLISKGEVGAGRKAIRAALRLQPRGYFTTFAAYIYAKSFDQAPTEDCDMRFAESMRQVHPELNKFVFLKAAAAAAGDPERGFHLLEEPRDLKIPDRILQQYLRGLFAFRSGMDAEAAATLRPLLGRLGLEDINLTYAELMIKLGDKREAMRALSPLKHGYSSNPHFRSVYEEAQG